MQHEISCSNYGKVKYLLSVILVLASINLKFAILNGEGNLIKFGQELYS